MKLVVQINATWNQLVTLLSELYSIRQTAL